MLQLPESNKAIIIERINVIVVLHADLERHLRFVKVYEHNFSAFASTLHPSVALSMQPLHPPTLLTLMLSTDCLTRLRGLFQPLFFHLCYSLSFA